MAFLFKVSLKTQQKFSQSAELRTERMGIAVVREGLCL